MAAVAPTRPGPSTTVQASADFEKKFNAFKTAVYNKNYEEMKPLINDSPFLDWLVTEHCSYLLGVLDTVVTMPTGQWDFVRTVFDRYHTEFEKLPSCITDRLGLVMQYLKDPQVCKTMTPAQLNGLALSMVYLQNWSGLESIIDKGLAGLSLQCLVEIVEGLPPECPQFAGIITKILPKLIADKSVRSAWCLFAIAKKTLQTNKDEIKPIGTKILTMWNRLSPYPLTPENKDDVELIVRHAPDQLGGCLMHLARPGGMIDPRDLIGQRPISAEELGEILLAADALEVPTARQGFIQEILAHPQAEHISKRILRYILMSFTIWETGQGTLRPMLPGHIALCKTLKKLIDS